MSNIPTQNESLFHQIASYISSCDCEMKKSLIAKKFPDVEDKRLLKALENACSRGLIHSVSRGVYRSGPRPFKLAIAMESHHDTSTYLDMALKTRRPIERAWFSVARGNRAIGAAA